MSQKTAYVFGSTPSTILTARLLELSGHTVSVFDPGNHFEIENPRFLNPDITNIPATEEFQEQIQQLALAAGTKVDIQLNDLSPMTWGEKNFQSFLGFGDQKNKSIPALSRHHLKATWVVTPSIESMFSDCLQNFKGEIYKFSELSKINCSATGIESVEINGNKNVSADLIVLAHTPRQLSQILPAHLFSERDWTKLNRSPIWSKLSIELPMTQSDWAANQTCFLIPNQSEFEPWIGLPGEIPAIWSCYLTEDKTEDPESIGAEIRQLKKMLAKSFPGLDENTPEPGIHLLPEAAGSYLWMEQGQKLEAGLENVLLISEIINDFNGLAASLAASCWAVARHGSRPDAKLESINPTPTLLDSNPLP